MSVTVADLLAVLRADTSDFKAGMETAASKMFKFQASSVAVGKLLADLGEKAAQMAKDAALYPLRATRHAAEYAESLDHLTAVTGLSAETLQGWGVSMNRVGVTSHDLGISMRQLSTNIVDAQNGVFEATQKFAAMGIAITKTSTTEQIFRQIATASEAMGNTHARTAAMIDLLGRSSTRMTPFMKDGTQALDEGSAASKRMTELTEAQLDVLRQARTTFDDLTLVTSRFSNQVGVVFAAQILAANKALIDLISSAAQWVQGSGVTLYRNILDLIISFKDLAVAVGKPFWDMLGGGSGLLQGINAQFIAMSTLIKELVANWHAIEDIAKHLSGTGTSTDSFGAITDRLQSRIETIEQQAKEALVANAQGMTREQLFGTTGNAVPGAGAKPGEAPGGVTFDIFGERQKREIEAINVVEQRREAALVQQTARDAARAAGYTAVLDAQIARREVTDASAAQMRARIQKELNQQEDAGQVAQLVSYGAFVAAKQALLQTADPKERVAFNADALAVIAKSQSDIKILTEKAENDRITGETAVFTAKAGMIRDGLQTERAISQDKLTIAAAENAGFEQLSAKRQKMNLTTLNAITQDTQAKTEDMARARSAFTAAELGEKAAARQADLQGATALASAKVDILRSSFGTFQEISAAQADLIRAQGAQALDQANLTSRQRVAIQQSTNARAHAEDMKATGGLVEQYRFGLHEYLTNTGNTFNIATDMARQTADAMAGGFKTLFFDMMQGRITSLKDAFRGIVNFVQQVIADVLAKMAAAKLIGFLGKIGEAAAGSGNGVVTDSSGASTQNVAANGGIWPKHEFAGGGIATSPQMAIFGEGATPEAFVPLPDGKTIPVTMSRGAAGGGNVTVNISNAPSGPDPKVNVRRELEGLIVDIIFRNVASNGPLRGLLQGA